MARRQTLVHLSEEQIGRLDRVAQRNKTSRSEIMRRAVDRYLEVTDVEEMDRQWAEGMRRSDPDPELDTWVDALSDENLRRLDEEDPW